MLFDMEGRLHINKHSKNADTSALYTMNHPQLYNNNGILVSERRWSAHQCWWALEWLKSPILEWQSLLQLEQM